MENRHSASKLQIILDNIIFNLQKSGGISVVWGELIKHLEKDIGCNTQYIEYGNPMGNIVRKDLLINEERILHPKIKCILLERYTPLKLRQEENKHIFHSSYYRYSKNPNSINITTVHDFTYEYFSTGIKAIIHKCQKYEAIRHSNHIVCISENTKNDLLHFLPEIAKEKIHVIYNGVSDDYHILDDSVAVNLPFSTHSYVLYIGARGGYKNFDFAVRALQGTPYKLVIVGPPLNEKEKKTLYHSLGKEGFVYVGRVPNKTLNILYNNAFALLYPSSYEGFGIPVIEAQKAGCPVIAYDSSSITEIIGKTPLLLKRLDIKLVHKYLKILTHSMDRQNIVTNGIANATYFSWDKTYQQYKELYIEAYNNLK